jgi:hypothetical protein
MILRFKSFRGSELKWIIFIRKRKDIIKLQLMKIHGRMNAHLYLLLPAFQVQVLIWTGDSGSNPEGAHGDKFFVCQ